MSEPMRAIVCGGRTYADEKTLDRFLDALHVVGPIALVIAGGAPGADTLAVEWADSRGVESIVEPADWERDGRAAGPIRNQRMIDEHAPTHLIAFPGGRGTADMLRRAERARLKIITVTGSFDQPPRALSSEEPTPQ